MVNFNISADPLPVDFSGTPQQLFEALLDRLEVTSDILPYADGGSTPPTEDIGPWFKNGTELYVWDAGAYRPLSVDESITPQIIASATAPDSAVYQYWLKIDATRVLGLYYYAGPTAGWVTQLVEITNGSVTTTMLADGSITSIKILNNSIKPDNIANGLPVSKWPRGTAKQFLRMNAAGTSPGWETLQMFSEVLPASITANVSFGHNLGVIPAHAEYVWVCITPENGWIEGEEVNSEHVYIYPEVAFIPVFKTENSVFIRCKNTLYMRDKNAADRPMNYANWGVRFNITVS